MKGYSQRFSREIKTAMAFSIATAAEDKALSSGHGFLPLHARTRLSQSMKANRIVFAAVCLNSWEETVTVFSMATPFGSCC
ncbi:MULTISPECIES: hypothetical protein [unclassified Desulfovibrio]|uniref:hypothetical protein n=1 Tax=unclassified Desulfovibrio TaxID=2593640 RepID=UPI002FD93DFF